MKKRKYDHKIRLGAFTVVTLCIAAMAAEAGDVTTDNLTVNRNLTVKNTAWTAAPTNGVMLYYSFSTNTTPVADDSGRGHTGTVSGATFTNGVLGGGYYFNGSASISSPSSGDFSFGTSGFTMVVWIRLTTDIDTGATDVRRMLARGRPETTGGTWAWGVGHVSAWGTGKRFNLYYNISGYHDLSSDALSISTNTWYHAALVRSNTTATFYLNGAAVGGGALSGSLSNSDTLLVGCRTVAGEYFTGPLDEIRIYNRALTPDEILGMYSLEANLPPGQARFETGIGYIQPIGDLSMGSYTNQP